MKSVKKINGYKVFLSKLLGKGSFGSVYLGEQDSTKTECAVKMISKERMKDSYLKRALISQIQILARLKCTNVVGFFDVLESSTNFYIVQEYCESDLLKLLERQKDRILEEEKAIVVLKEIANGMLTLVKEGIVHRDLKPQNILIKQGVLKIADFGFAKGNIHKNVKNLTVLGTPLYMSLEMLTGKQYTSKCDVWAIGCIFYEILHGRTPWAAKAQFELIENIKKIPLKIDPKLNPRTKDFLLRALKIFQEDRMSWDELFGHPIFQGYFNKYRNQNKAFQDKYKKFMGNLRFKINSDNIDIEKLFDNLGLQAQDKLDFDKFEEFLLAIDSEMGENQCYYFFEKLDKSGQGQICLSELTDQLEKYEISLSSKNRHRLKDSKPSIRQLQINLDELSLNGETWSFEFEKKLKKCFKKLFDILTHKKLTLSKLFNIYDMDKNGTLEVQQFFKILKNMDSTFTKQEAEAVFKVLDQDGSNAIEFEEFNNYYCRVNGIPSKTQLPQSYQQKIKKKKVQKENMNRPKRKTAY